EAVHRAKPGRGRGPLVYGELLTQGEVLDREPAVAAAEEREQPKQVEHGSDHRAGSVSGSEPTDQRLARRPRFWRRTGLINSFADPSAPSRVRAAIRRRRPAEGRPSAPRERPALGRTSTGAGARVEPGGCL